MSMLNDGLDEGGPATVVVAQQCQGGQVGLFAPHPQPESLLSHPTNPRPDLPLQLIQNHQVVPAL